MTQQPSNFLGGPSYRPEQRPLSQTYEPRAPYAPRAVACLTIRRDERALLNGEAARLFADGTKAVELQGPVRFRDKWQLSTQPGARCNLSPSGSGGQCFRAPLAARALFADKPEQVQQLHFGLEPVGNGIFRLYPLTVNN